MVTTRADMHCHSTASAVSKLGVQRALGLPECATEPEEVYELAKQRGMAFVTITDHDTIDGVMTLADRPDVFVSEELTASFRGEPQAVHVLCYGITPEHHEWLQQHAGDVEECAEFLHEENVACALAHPFYTVNVPLAPRHRRRLAELFPVWETRNGARAHELNMPAAVYIETHGGIGIGGSDDHAGVDIGRTFTETAAVATPERFLAEIRAGRALARGQHGSAAKWAHTALALAARVVQREACARPDPLRVLTMVERVMRDGETRGGATAQGLTPADARDLLRAWLESVQLDLDEDGLIAYLQTDESAHSELFRRARRAHERRLERAAATALRPPRDLARAARELFEACIAALPYAPAGAFLGREKAKLLTRDGEPRRIALVADGLGSVHGVKRTLDEIRERGVPGYDVEVVGTDVGVDCRLPCVCEVELPFYEGLEVGVPSLPGLVDVLAERHYDAIHVCSPGPAGVGAALVARMVGLPAVGSYHTELAEYAQLRSGDSHVAEVMTQLLGLFYRGSDLVLSPGVSSDRSLRSLGVDSGRIVRWERGVDVERFTPSKRVAGLLPGQINVLYAGRQTKEKGVGLLADAFLRAAARDSRLHLALAGGGPEEGWLRERLGDRATFLGWLDGDALARAYASADVFLFASGTDTFGQVILEAQASGLPVVAVAAGGPMALVQDGVNGRLCPPDAGALASALVELASSAELRASFAAGGLETMKERSWERALAQLAGGYRRALEERARGDDPRRLRASTASSA